MEEVKGNLIAKGLKFGIVISRFNEFVSSKLLDGAEDTLVRQGADEKDISSVWVPGSFEIPPVALRLAR